MTTASITAAATATKTPPEPAPAPGGFRFPEPPQREPDEMTSFKQLHKTGSSHYLDFYFGNSDTTLVAADLWVAQGPRPGTRGLRRPDLLIAFDVDPAAYDATGGYLISEQGKPPDFVLEVASESTARVDVGEKRVEYAALGIPEYWRFDETGEFHRTRLAGDRLVGGQYEPIPIEELPDGSLQGYSAALNLYLRWERVPGDEERGQLGWYDPETGQHIPTIRDKQEALLQAEARAEQEQAGRLRAEARADSAEARIRALEEENRRLRNG